MRAFIFIGGSGRSGTSFLTEAIALDKRVVSFPSVELKFVTSKDGLLDLRYHLVDEYNIDSAQQGLSTFEIYLKRVLFQTYFNPVPVESYCDPNRLGDAAGKFIASMQTDGRASPQSDITFDRAARLLLEEMYAARISLQADLAPVYNLEKTPHSLLHMKSLDHIFPGSRFIHVMRDPRAVVLSLLKVEWAPNTIAECITWMKCYCLAWQRSRKAALSAGAHLLELKLEDIANARDDVLISLRNFLDLDLPEDVFDGVRADVTTSWRENCTVEELSALTAGLSGEVRSFGYVA